MAQATAFCTVHEPLGRQHAPVAGACTAPKTLKGKSCGKVPSRAGASFCMPFAPGLFVWPTMVTGGTKGPVVPVRRPSVSHSTQ